MTGLSVDEMAAYMRRLYDKSRRRRRLGAAARAVVVERYDTYEVSRWDGAAHAAAAPGAQAQEAAGGGGESQRGGALRRIQGEAVGW